MTWTAIHVAVRQPTCTEALRGLGRGFLVRAGSPYNASAYTGIRLLGQDRRRHIVGVRVASPTRTRSLTVGSARRTSPVRTSATTTTAHALPLPRRGPIHVPFSSLSQDGWGRQGNGFDPSTLYEVLFQIPVNAKFGIWIDDIAFTLVFFCRRRRRGTRRQPADRVSAGARVPATPRRRGGVASRPGGSPVRGRRGASASSMPPRSLSYAPAESRSAGAGEQGSRSAPPCWWQARWPRACRRAPAASSFSFKPPMGDARRGKVISPVMATSRTPGSRTPGDTSTQAMS